MRRAFLLLALVASACAPPDPTIGRLLTPVDVAECRAQAIIASVNQPTLLGMAVVQDVVMDACLHARHVRNVSSEPPPPAPATPPVRQTHAPAQPGVPVDISAYRVTAEQVRLCTIWADRTPNPTDRDWEMRRCLESHEVNNLDGRR